MVEAERKLGKEVDKAIGDITPQAGLSIRIVGGKGKPEQPASKYSFADKKIEARFQNAKGIKKPSISTTVKKKFTALKNKALREYEHLPRNKEFARLRFDLLKLKKQRGVSSDRTLRAIQGITIDLNKNSYDLFTRKVILADLATVAEKGKDLPFGFTKKSLDIARESLKKEVEANPTIKDAVKKRKRFWDALKKDHIEAMKAIGKDVSYIEGNKNYYRHQVLEYANLKGTFGTGKKLKSPVNRGFLKKRKGSESDINTDYLEAEHEVMAQMLNDIEIAKTIKAVDKNYNIIKEIKKTAKEKNLEDWHEAIPEGYSAWQPREGNVFFMSDSISAKLAEQLMEDSLLKLEISQADLKKVLAVGGKHKEFVVKNEIAETLDNLAKGHPDDIIPMASRKIMTGWKQWQLISPRRYAKYNIRNMTGDADAAFVGNPSGFKKVPQAVRDLYNLFYGDKAMTPDMKAWFERGGMESTLQALEMGSSKKLKGTPSFKKSFSKENL